MNTVKNKVHLVGHLGADPQIKIFDNGNKMVRFSIATHDYYTNKKGERVVDTQWHNVVIWGKLANTAEETLEKGSEVAIDGKLSSRSYTDKEGVKKYFTEIVVNEFTLIDKKETEKAA